MKTLARLAALLSRSRKIGTRLDALRALNAQRVDGDRQPGRRVIYAKPHPKVKIGWFHRRLLRGEFKRKEA
jgi:hypothetical protein